MPHDTTKSDPVEGAITLDADSTLLKRYYAGTRLESPMGGYLDPVGVRPSGNGPGLAVFECTSSSLRFVLTIPPATRRDKEKVKAQIDGGEDPYCPRHGPSSRLQRVGQQMVCPRCGVAFRKAAR